MAFGIWHLAFGENSQLPHYVRVAIIQDTLSLRLKISGFYEVIDSTNNKVLYRGKNLNTTVTTYRDTILIGNINFHSNKVLIKTQDVNAIVINDRKFRGDIQFIKKNNSRLSVINYIELEDYIKGILYHEASHYWPVEVLKAQAIACRTYAVYQIQENVLRDYDVTSDIYSQVYGGRISERYRTNKVVDETKNLVLTYQGKSFPAYYHATCAGHTEDASLLWNIDIVPLKGVVCNFCKDSPHFKWHSVLSVEDINNKLVNAGYKISDIRDIQILGRDKSGRIANFKIITANNKELKISGKDLRNIIGPNIIRSTNFMVNVVKGEAVFDGVGWGHGAGLCQWGAYFMAKQGYTAEQILEYYYPKSVISNY